MLSNKGRPIGFQTLVQHFKVEKQHEETLDWHGKVEIVKHFTTTKGDFICQMISLDFEGIHWLYWTGTSEEIVNSLV
jgi:hypothetical protein